MIILMFFYKTRASTISCNYSSSQTLYVAVLLPLYVLTFTSPSCSDLPFTFYHCSWRHLQALSVINLWRGRLIFFFFLLDYWLKCCAKNSTGLETWLYRTELEVQLPGDDFPLVKSFLRSAYKLVHFSSSFSQSAV